MKNKLFLICLALIMILAVAGCSADEPAENSEESNSQQASEQVAEKDTSNGEEAPAQEVHIDSSLEGMDLLKAISGERPKSMSMKMKTDNNGMSTNTLVYYDGDNSRTETSMDGYPTSIFIYNVDEEAMYSYVEGEENGIRIVGADIKSAEDVGLTMDMSTKFSELAEGVADGLIARMEKLGEEEVVYIESTESDEEMGDIIVKMWYSVNYNMPLKYEIYIGQNQLVSLNVTEIEKDIKIDKDMFAAPSDIVFQDVDIEGMMYD